MKKLISKNPVEQFKTGIRFAKGGMSFNMSGLRRHGSLANATYTDWNGKVVFKNGQLTADAKNYLLNKYGKDYTLRTEANMRKGNIWDRSLKTSKSPYGKWRIDNGRADSKWNNEIARKALKNRTDVKKDINGNLYLKVKNSDGTYSQMYLNDDSVYSKQSPETSIVNFEDLSPKEKEELLSRYTLKFQVNPLVGLVGLGGIFSKFLSRTFASPKVLPSTLKMLESQKLLGAPTINGVQVYTSPPPSSNYEWVKYIPVNKKGGKLKVKMADGSGTITIDTPDKDQLAGRKPVGKTKDGENLYLNGDGKVVKHDSKEGSEQTNWMEKGGITKHQRGAKFMGTGVQRGWTSSYGNNLWNGITADLKLALIGTGKFTEDSFKDARSLQTALNKYFEGNAATMNNRDFTASRIAVDNKWGDLSLKALMHALSMANYDEARPLNVSNVNPINGPLNGMSTIPTKIEARPEHMYNRAEVRQLLRNQGINPYSLSGALRQAIRFALNGGHKYNKALLQGIDLKRLTQPVTVGNKETSTFNTPPASNPGTITYTASINNGNMSIPTIQIKDPGHIPTVSVAKLGGRLISKDPVKLFKLGGSIAKYGLGDRMKSYVKKKKSELNRAKAAANNWSGYELTYPEFTQNGIVTKGVVSGRNYVPEATVTASKEGARKSRLNEASQRNASLAKMQDTLFRIGAYDRNKTLYRQAVDGLMGGLTRNAIKRAREMGYDVNEKTGEIKKLNRKGLAQRASDFVHNANEKMKSVKGPVENPRKNNFFDMLYTPGTTPSYVQKLMYNLNSDLRKVAKFLLDNGVSKELIINLNIPKKAMDRNGRPTQECAAFINATLKQNGIESWGDSFKIPNQFKKVINGYDFLKDSPKNDAGSITQWHKAASDSLANNLNTSTLDPNHAYTVNMYYTDRSGRPSSHTVDFYNKAKESGSKYFGTHVGLLYHDLPSNTWRVTHNIGGNLHNEEFSEDLGSKSKYGYGIVGITDAGQIKKAPEIVYNPNGNQNSTPNKDDYKWYYKYVNPVKDLLGIKY